MMTPELPDRDDDYLRVAEYLAGRCSETEVVQIEHELLIDPSLQYAAGLVRLALSVTPDDSDLDVDAALAALTNRIENAEGPRSRMRRALKRLTIVVGVAAMLVIGLATYLSLAPVIAGHFNEKYDAPMESRRIIRLPDGSRATLEPGARITYRASFFPRPRSLTLEGEARFQVRPDAERPFEVHANGILVRAVGTVFTVRANPWDSTVRITVEDGVVKVQSERSAVAHVITVGQTIDLSP